MKKVLFLLVFSLFAVSATFAQTEKGKFRVGGASNMGFFNIKPDGGDATNSFDLSVEGSYFIINNLAVEAGVNYEYSKMKGQSSQDGYGFNVGARYYFPVKVFVAASFDAMQPTGLDDMGLGLGFRAGYAWFLNDKVALEPAIGYRLGLSDKDKGTKFDGFGAQIGISIYF